MNEIDSLILRINSDADAFEKLYTILIKDVFACSLSILPNEQLAEDAVNETFIRLYNTAHKFKPQGYGRAYVLKICKNVSHEILRQNNRQYFTDKLPEQACAAPDDNNLFIEQLLKGLKQNERQIIILHYYADFTFKEISKTLSIPEGTVKWRHNAAIKKCRKLYGKTDT